MKTLKLLLLLLIASTIFFSCSDNDPINNQADTESSTALRTLLTEYKKAHGIAGRTASDVMFCFDFVYPITLTYNNGTAVTVTSSGGLFEILSNESEQFYLDGIVFPFQVTLLNATQEVVTIHTETEFVELLQYCGIDIIDEDLQTSFCFDIVFPISVTSSQGNVIINNMEEFELYMNSASSGPQTEIVFPISVLYAGQVEQINNLYEFYELVSSCDSCICEDVYAPVCVQTASGLVEYGNSCHAFCAGYSPIDLIQCSPPTDCTISSLSVQTGTCNTDGTYALTINFTYSNPVSSQFEVRNNSNHLIGTYNLADLPVTINHYANFGQSEDFMTINIVGDPTCIAVQQWTVPCANSCASLCSTDFEPVCVMTATGPVQFGNQCLAECAGYTPADLITCGVAVDPFTENLGTCFFISYPVAVQYQGALVTVNSNSHLLQYYSPAFMTMPDFNYPITVTFGNTAHLIESQSEFETLISTNCN
ncbi:MAG TPA: hypothetical protein VF581_11535 [Flavobacterium sp.]